MAESTRNGWLDVHGHFRLPQSPEREQELVELYHQAKFMVSGPSPWNVKDVLQYNNAAGIRMQMLSCIPESFDALKNTNDYGARIVQEHPTRFGLLAALPTDDPAACLQEIIRTASFPEPADGFAVTTVRNGWYLGDDRLSPVWKELDSRKAVVHIHPCATAPPSLGRPIPLIEVAFDTTRTVVDMLYNGVFRRFPNIKFILAHCGGVLPVLSGRLQLLGTQIWVPNPHDISRDEIEGQLGKLYVDTAATAKTGLAPALKLCGVSQCIYGSDCGVPCSTDGTMDENRRDVINVEVEHGIPVNTIGNNGWDLFPKARARALLID